MSSPPASPQSILLLGAGELSKEIAISAQRLGVRVIAADRYPDAPAMGVAHHVEIFSLADTVALEGVVRTHGPDLILPEIEHIGTETFEALEAQGFRVVPSADAAGLARTRHTVRAVALESGLRTPRNASAASEAELHEVCDSLGYPCVVKPMESTSGKGETVVQGPSRIERAWNYAQEESSGEVLVEEHVEFREEVTLPVVRGWDGSTTFCDPIAHRRERGGYRESWVPAGVTDEVLTEMRDMSEAITSRLGGVGVFGVEFFLTDDEVIFAALRLGPHDTGMVTMISQELSQFDLHVRAVLGLPTPVVRTVAPSASAVILADRDGRVSGYHGLDRALQVETVRIRLFGAPDAYPYRRMGVALARGSDAAQARARALEAAGRVTVEYV